MSTQSRSVVQAMIAIAMYLPSRAVLQSPRYAAHHAKQVTHVCCKTAKAGKAADLCHVWCLYARVLTQAHESGAHHTARLWQARRSHASLQDRRWEWSHLLLMYLHLRSLSLMVAGTRL